VVWVGRLVEIIGVAACAIGGCTGVVPSGMTKSAVRRKVCPRQREVSRIMVKSAIRLTRRVAGQAGRIFIDIAHHAPVLIVRFWVDMADGTTVHGVIVRVDMALRATAPDALVLAAVNREVLRIVRQVLRWAQSLVKPACTWFGFCAASKSGWWQAAHWFGVLAKSPPAWQAAQSLIW
jgi:hypothetical protein